MSVSALSSLDMNLLLALDVLLAERHVTRAAKRLGVSQSAMSQSLQRLRDALQDPLLVRSGAQMVATPRAQALAGPLKAALQALERVISSQEAFEPAHMERSFSFSCLDTCAVSILPPLLAQLAQAGPRLNLEVSPMRAERVFELLRGGDLDVALIGPWSVPDDIYTEPLIAEHLVSMVRQDHPILSDPSPEAFVRWPHVVFRLSNKGDTAVDRALERMGLKRRVVGATPYFLSAPALVAESDLIVNVPYSVARIFVKRWPVALFEPPLDGRLSYTVSTAWPAYLDADPGHRWLRELIRQIGASLG